MHPKLKQAIDFFKTGTLPRSSGQTSFGAGLVLNPNQPPYTLTQLDQLEQAHDYIQWLFPTIEKGTNPKAPFGFSQTDVNGLSTDDKEAAQDALKLNLRYMLAFYGLEIKPSMTDLQIGEIVGNTPCAFAYRQGQWMKPDDHNHLRLTRMVDSLATFGLHEQSQALLRKLLDLAKDNPRSFSKKTIEIWKSRLPSTPAATATPTVTRASPPPFTNPTAAQMHPEINRRLGGSTSDHARRFFEVAFVGTPPVTLRGGTWNLMDKAHKINNYGFANNPLLIEEDDNQYQARKKLQLNSLLTDIEKERLDFVFLQEVDFMRYPELNGPFLQKLNEKGYAVDYVQGSSSQQAFVTIYRKGLLTLQKTQGALPNAQGKYRAVKSHFVLQGSAQPVVLMNAHLDYNMDYSQGNVLDNALKENPNAFLIAGGDMNHRPETKMDQLITDKQPSVVCAVQDRTTQPHTYQRGRDGNSILSLDHEDTGDRSAYDGLFVSPPSAHRAQIRFTGGEAIEMNHGVARFKPLPPAGKVRVSEHGKVYKNEKYLIKALDRKLGDKSVSPGEKMKAYREIDEWLNKRKARKGKWPQKLEAALVNYANFKATLAQSSNSKAATPPPAVPPTKAATPTSTAHTYLPLSPQPAATTPSTSPSPAAQQILTAIHAKNYYPFKLGARQDKNRANEHMIEVHFYDESAAKEFAKFAGGAPVEGKVVLLGYVRANTQFQAWGLKNNTKGDHHPVAVALINEVTGKQTQTQTQTQIKKQPPQTGGGGGGFTLR